MDSEPFAKQLTLLDVKSNKEMQLPEKIGPYVIEALIAKSNYSIIYLGYNPENRQVVALKVLLPEFLQKKAMVSSFINEGTIIQMASHPNIVKLYAQGQWEGGLYIAMEFIRGISLRQFIRQHSLSLKRSLDIVLQVCYALCHLHAHGIVHGDLKPENILITEDGEVKVLDFGIAKMHSSLNADITLAGTPSYMSPEHKINASGITYSSDIYSLGIIAYELITGKLSFGIVSINHVPKLLRPIIEKCLKKSLSERYSDVVDLIQDLSNFFKHELSQDKLPEDNESSLEIDLTQDIAEAFPLPQIYLGSLDFGISRSFSKKTISPVLAHVFDDNSLLLGLFAGTGIGIKNNLSESMVNGFINFYLHELPTKKFSFATFCQKINMMCFRSKLQLDFSFLHMDAYLDELHICSGGFLAPIIVKNKKPASLFIDIISPRLGESMEPLSLRVQSFDIGDQFIMHTLKTKDATQKLIKEHADISSYSAQILAETLIKKMPLLNLNNIITCLKVK